MAIRVSSPALPAEASSKSSSTATRTRRRMSEENRKGEAEPGGRPIVDVVREFVIRLETQVGSGHPGETDIEEIHGPVARGIEALVARHRVEGRDGPHDRLDEEGLHGPVGAWT